ncbi:sugar porter family MFS transporter [Streptomyces sp. TRM S81-3]|uniref:Sugar porter family MFS transporter n=1 Tax=Streptomyces griseicoloratus TaxID=2752516 RepID=A0A926QV20_9ACTN|nr:sugar porter family MFS transporter [Streptomyces griseicoloratus]MBD0424555.1 sugar porter family MFS transporter [Streptomyces griseicoloratus]
MQGFTREPGVQGPLAVIPAAGKRKIFRWTATIAVGGFLFGYDTGVVSGALLFVTREFDLNAAQQGSIVSVLLIGAMVGALTAGRIADRLGRRRTLALEGVVFVVGTVIAVSATGYGMLLGARVVLGLAVGGASATVPVYLSEIAPAEIRGRILSANQLMITVGILVSYLVDLAFSGSGDWRAMFAIGLIPGCLLVLGALLVVPESPVWMIRNHRTAEVRKLIASVTGEEQADRLIAKFRSRHEEQQRSGSAAGRPERKGWRALTAPAVRPALIVGLTLAAIQQFGGINTIIYYAPTIIEKTGLTASNSIFYSVFIGVINLVMTLVSIKLVDRIGRRRLLTGSLAGMLVTLALLGLSFVAGLPSELSVVFMVLYIAAYACGVGPVFWVLVGEVFPPSARAVGSSASTTVNWLSNFVVSQAFLPVAGAIGQGETFWLFGVICVAGLVFVGRFVPETKGRDYDEVDMELQARFGRRRRPVGTGQRG